MAIDGNILTSRMCMHIPKNLYNLPPRLKQINPEMIKNDDPGNKNNNMWHTITKGEWDLQL
jgi:hypothetical protein